MTKQLKQRLLAGVIVIILLLIVVGGYFGWQWWEGERRLQRAQEIAAEEAASREVTRSAMQRIATIKDAENAAWRARLEAQSASALATHEEMVAALDIKGLIEAARADTPVLQPWEQPALSVDEATCAGATDTATVQGCRDNVWYRLAIESGTEQGCRSIANDELRQVCVAQLRMGSLESSGFDPAVCQGLSSYAKQQCYSQVEYYRWAANQEVCGLYPREDRQACTERWDNYLIKRTHERGNAANDVYTSLTAIEKQDVSLCTPERLFSFGVHYWCHIEIGKLQLKNAETIQKQEFCMQFPDRRDIILEDWNTLSVVVQNVQEYCTEVLDT